MTPVRILGVGSPFGEDQAGWLAMKELADSGLLKKFPDGLVSTGVCDRPGSQLLEQMRGAELVILVDAAVTGSARPGTVLRKTVADIAAEAGLFSSHGFGVVSALALGHALGILPERLVILAVEIDGAAFSVPHAKLSEPVRSAMAALPEKIGAEITQWLDERAAAGKSADLRHPSTAYTPVR